MLLFKHYWLGDVRRRWRAIWRMRGEAISRYGFAGDGFPRGTPLIAGHVLMDLS